MRIRALTVVSAALALLLGVRTAAADGNSALYAQQMEAKAASVVTVKFVLKVQARQGGGQEREVNGTINGVVVDASGVVMLNGDLLGFGGGGGRRMMGVAKTTASNFRVVFEGDVKEYDAILGATDSKLGLQFVRIKDLGDRKVVPLDLSAAVEPKVGDELFGVSRLEQGFDYAPFFGTTRIVAQVTKPRSMWFITGFGPIAHPLFNPEGKVAGIVVRQSGVSEGEEGGAGQERVFLLPVKSVTGTIAQAVKASAEALEKSKAAATKEPEEPAPGMTDAPAAPPAPPGMDDPK